MFTQRLSLIVNNRQIPFEANDSFAETIVKEEGELILSYLVNLKDEECKYENPKTLEKRWLLIQSPEIAFLDKYYEMLDENLVEYPASRIMKKYKEVTNTKIPLDILINTMKNEGYAIKYGSNIISNIKEKVIQAEPVGQTKL